MTTEGSMQTVDLADWRFSFESDPRVIGTPLEEPPKTFEFSTAIVLRRQQGVFQRNRSEADVHCCAGRDVRARESASARCKRI